LKHEGQRETPSPKTKETPMSSLSSMMAAMNAEDANEGYGDDDDSGFRIISETIHTATVDLRETENGYWILPGQRYMERVSLRDGEMEISYLRVYEWMTGF
jgi:hypothetical protein